MSERMGCAMVAALIIGLLTTCAVVAVAVYRAVTIVMAFMVVAVSCGV